MSSTLKTVAVAAGVSTMAAATVLNGSGKTRVSAETRAKILRIAKQQGYHRNLAASSIRTRKVDIIGIFVHYLDYCISESLSRINYGILSGLSEAGFNARVFDTESLEKGVKSACENRITRAIYIGTNAADRRTFKDLCDRNGIRPVFIYETPVDDAPAVNADNEEAGYLAGLTLLRSGCRRIGMISYPEAHSVYITDRQAGFLRAMDEGGCLATSLPLLTRCLDWRKATDELLALPDNRRPDALFTLSDDFALYLQSRIMHMGLAVPKDIAYISCGNFNFSSQLLPALTTMDMGLVEIGRSAVKLLLGGKCSANEKKKNLFLVPPKLIFRDTTPMRKK